MSRFLRRLLHFGLLGLCGCNGTIQSDDQRWGKAVAAPGQFVSAPNSEALSLPSTVSELDAYIARTGAISDHRGPGKMLSAPTPLPRSICQPTSEAVVFSYPYQAGGFVPGYTAHVTNGTVLCIDRSFAYFAP